VYRVEVLTLLGLLADAESEGVRASEELLALEPRIACEALYAVGEIRRRRGDFIGAEAALRHAHELGRDPQPGLALIRLAQGRVEDAASLLLSVGDVTGPPLTKCRYLAAQVEVALAACDISSAREASCKLDELALAAPRTVLQATTITARAAVLLANGDVESALVASVAAGAHWQELQMPYEAARALVLCGDARRRLGQHEAARLDFEAAHAGFERIGARREVLEVAKRLSGRTIQQHGLSIREVEVLRLLASGRTNRQIGAELFVSEHTISRHLQNIYAKIRVSSRAAATAFAYKHDLVQSGPDRSDGVFTP
jgi:ATP/maltotriose-dependent transcriptional regulator MalT